MPSDEIEKLLNKCVRMVKKKLGAEIDLRALSPIFAADANQQLLKAVAR